MDTQTIHTHKKSDKTCSTDSGPTSSGIIVTSQPKSTPQDPTSIKDQQKYCKIRRLNFQGSQFKIKPRTVKLWDNTPMFNPIEKPRKLLKWVFFSLLKPLHTPFSTFLETLIWKFIKSMSIPPSLLLHFFFKFIANHQLPPDHIQQLSTHVSSHVPTKLS